MEETNDADADIPLYPMPNSTPVLSTMCSTVSAESRWPIPALKSEEPEQDFEERS